MTIEENVQVVKDFFAAIGGGDERGVLALVAEDIEWIIPGEAWPLAGTHRGHAGLAAVLRKASQELETSYPAPPEFVARGDRVLVVGVATGTIKATNKPFEDHWVFDITVRNGKVTKIREYIDTQALARAATLKEIPMYDPSTQSELIRFARVEAGGAVIDVYPGEGEWTRLFSDIVGPQGRVYAFVPAEVAHFQNDPVGRMQTLAKEPGRENVEAVSADLVAVAQVTQPADVVWLHLFYHDLHTPLMQAKGATAAAFNRAVFERLKPGGAYVIVDHAAAGETGASAAPSLHRIEPAAVRQEVEAAGFVLDAQSALLANPDDAHTVKVFDPSIKGQTDRFAYRFVKP
jgi:predicted methyltransferase